MDSGLTFIYEHFAVRKFVKISNENVMRCDPYCLLTNSVGLLLVDVL